MVTKETILKRIYKDSVESTESTLKNLNTQQRDFGLPVSGDELTLLKLKTREV